MTGFKVSTVITLVGMFVGGAVGGAAYIHNGDAKTKEEAKLYTTEELKKTDRYYKLQFDTIKKQIDDIDEKTSEIHKIIMKKYGS